MDFERAAAVRDQVVKLRAQLEGKAEEDILGDLKKTARKGSAFGARKSSYGGGRRSLFRDSRVGTRISGALIRTS